MRYAGGTDETGQPIDVRDPMAGRLLVAWDSADDAAGRVSAFLAIRDVFPEDLAGNTGLQEGLTEALEGLTRRGARAMILALTDT
jgi:fructuronate reductase